MAVFFALATAGVVRADETPAPYLAYSFDGTYETNSLTTAPQGLKWTRTSADRWQYAKSPNGQAVLLKGSPYSGTGPDLTVSAWTVLMYARPASITNRVLWSSGHSTVVNSIALVSTGLDGVKMVRISGNKVFSDMGVSATVTNAPAEWHSYAIVYSGGTLSLYVDGTLSGSAPHSLQTDYKSLQFGSFYGGNPPCAQGGLGLYAAESGAVDEFRHYNAALTAEELAALHANFSANVHTANADPYYAYAFDGNLTATGSAPTKPTWSGTKTYFTSPNTKAISLAGRPYCNMQEFVSKTGDWTFMLVAKMPSYKQILANIGRKNVLHSLVLTATDGHGMSVSTCTGTDAYSTLITYEPEDGTTSYWHTYALTYRAVDQRLVLYVDGAFAGDYDGYENIAPSTGSYNGIQLGSIIGGVQGGFSAAGSGGVDDFRVWTNALDSAQVVALHNSFEHVIPGYTATISGAMNWSDIPWDGGAVWAGGETVDVTLTLTGDTTLTLDEAVPLGTLTVSGYGNGFAVAGTETLTAGCIVSDVGGSFGCPVVFSNTYWVDTDAPMTFSSVTSVFPDEYVVNSTKAATRTIYGTHNWTQGWTIPKCDSMGMGVVIADGAYVTASQNVETQSGSSRSAIRISAGGTLDVRKSLCMRTAKGYGIFDVSGVVDLTSGHHLYIENAGGCGFGSTDGGTTANPNGRLVVRDIICKTVSADSTLAVKRIDFEGYNGAGMDVSSLRDVSVADGVTFGAKGDYEIKSSSGRHYFLMGGLTFDTEDPDDGTGHTVTVSAVLAERSSDVGTITKTGAGTLYLEAGTSTNDWYSGGTYVQKGTVRVAADPALGFGTASVAAGAELSIAAGVSVTNSVSLAEGAVLTVEATSVRTTAAVGALAASGAATVGLTGDMSSLDDSVTIPIASHCDAQTFANLSVDVSELTLPSADGWSAKLKRTDDALAVRISKNGFVVIIR